MRAAVRWSMIPKKPAPDLIRVAAGFWKRSSFHHELEQMMTRRVVIPF
jgi:hypothetical protein